jgi:hypothetical protein
MARLAWIVAVDAIDTPSAPTSVGDCQASGKKSFAPSDGRPQRYTYPVRRVAGYCRTGDVMLWICLG